jgi:hypothetical protein
MSEIMRTIFNSSQESEKRTNFFYAISENNISKFGAMTFSIISTPFIMLLLYGIIWFEKYGVDKKRTILNQLVSSICWTALGANTLVQVPRVIQYLTGRYSQMFLRSLFDKKNY